MSIEIPSASPRALAALCAAALLVATPFGAPPVQAQTTAPARAPAAATTQPVATPGCEATITGNDRMQFDVKSLSFKRSCREIRVTLRNVGKLPKAAMGHNWVLVRTAEIDAVAKDAIAAGLANEYLKPNDPRVIAATRLLGPGESATVTIPIARLKPDEKYTYFCSFPGHYVVMRGSLTLVP